MRINGNILGYLSKGAGGASIFALQNDETVTETPAMQAIETEFETELETEDVQEMDIPPDEIEAEETACYVGDGEPEMAQGIILGELGQMVQVIQVKQVSDMEERQAMQTICRTETNLSHSLVEQINGGRPRVVRLLQKHEIFVPAIVLATGSNEMADFDMDDFF